MIANEHGIRIILFQDQVGVYFTSNVAESHLKKEIKWEESGLFLLCFQSPAIYSESTNAFQKRYFKNREKYLLICTLSPFPLKWQLMGIHISMGARLLLDDGHSTSSTQVLSLAHPGYPVKNTF